MLWVCLVSLDPAPKGEYTSLPFVFDLKFLKIAQVIHECVHTVEKKKRHNAQKYKPQSLPGKYHS